MLDPIAFNFHVEMSRIGVRHAEILGGAESISIARALFWAAVDSKASSLRAGETITLRQGARVIIVHPPEPPAW